ncbi:MAG: glutamate--tRNA ligase [Candidatus Methylomirabilales bacterium]
MHQYGSMVRLRFAPSPTGDLHLGGARTALVNWLFARRHGGRFILRIEDTDPARSTPGSERRIVEDLQWLGLEWDEGPDRGGDTGPYRQSERFPLYHEIAMGLVERGAAYRCFCTAEVLERDRRETIQLGRPPRYVGRCRNLDPEDARARADAGEPHVLRFRVHPSSVTMRDELRGDVHFDTDAFGDFVLLRTDGRPAYNFAVTVDDALMAITDVIRGEDHLPNTPRQILLYQALGWSVPRFTHLPLLLGRDRAPLSKRHGAPSVRELREAGYLAEAVVNCLARIGWRPERGGDEILSLDELAAQFALTRQSTAPAIFDPKRLDWFSARVLRTARPEVLAELAVTHLARAGLSASTDSEYLMRLIEVLRNGMTRLADLPQAAEIFFRFDPARAAQLLSGEDGRRILEALKEELRATDVSTADGYRSFVEGLQARTGRRGGALLRPVRIAVTGKEVGPELALLLPLLGCEEVARRVEATLAALSTLSEPRHRNAG